MSFYPRPGGMKKLRTAYNSSQGPPVHRMAPQYAQGYFAPPEQVRAESAVRSGLEFMQHAWKDCSLLWKTRLDCCQTVLYCFFICCRMMRSGSSQTCYAEATEREEVMLRDGYHSQFQSSYDSGTYQATAQSQEFLDSQGPGPSSQNSQGDSFGTSQVWELNRM